jgi:hypothetical protein
MSMLVGITGVTEYVGYGGEGVCGSQHQKGNSARRAITQDAGRTGQVGSPTEGNIFRVSRGQGEEGFEGQEMMPTYLSRLGTLSPMGNWRRGMKVARGRSLPRFTVEHIILTRRPEEEAESWKRLRITGSCSSLYS